MPLALPLALQLAALLVGASWLPAGVSAAQTRAPALASCDELGRQGATLEQVTDCVADVGEDRGRRPAAIERLEELRRQHPEDPWPTYRLAFLEWYSDRRRSAELYALAADGFAAVDRNDLAVTALLNAARMLGNATEYDRAAELIDRADALTDRSADPDAAVKVSVDRAHVLYLDGRDLARAYRILLDIEPRARSISPSESTNWLDSAAKVTYDLGLLRQSLVYRRQLIDELDAAGETWSMAQAKYGFAITYRVLYESSLTIRGEYRDLLLDALATAEGAENDTVAILANLELGRTAPGPEARSRLEGCLARSSERDYQLGIILCSRALAHVLSASDPVEADRLLDFSTERAIAANDLHARVFGSAERLMIRWDTLPRREAIDDALATLELIETYRRLQSSSSGRTGVFSLWAPTYRRVAGMVLGMADDGSTPGPTDIALAFEVVERMRARTLTDDLEREQAIPSLTDVPSGDDYADALLTIVEAQSVLLDPGLGAEDRARREAELRRAEARELAMREDLAGVDPRMRAWTPEFARVADVQGELATNEALFSFQIGLQENPYGDFAGGAWLTAITREATRVYRLPDRTTLDAVAPAFAGLAARRGAPWRPRAAALYRALLEGAVDDLPPGVDTLIIVPDGPLNRLPFAALAPDGGDPLAARYAMSITPSATLWLRWRTTGGTGDRGETSRALVFADPALSGNAGGSVAPVGGGPATPERLGPLPYARAEGRAIATHLGPLTTLVSDAAASEDELKKQDLSRYRIVHFAAHAVLDEDLPERSAIYLAAGSADQDGLLQGREIIRLRLEGKIVVLSGCQSAAGAVLQGEGVMSLARSFFQAGATTVIGSLWPLRDDDAAAFFDDFYRHLARGTRVDEALQAAQRDRRRAGAPATAWAGLVVLGDGSTIPFPGGVEAPVSRLLLLLALVATAVLALFVYALLRRRQSV